VSIARSLARQWPGVVGLRDGPQVKSDHLTRQTGESLGFTMLLSDRNIASGSEVCARACSPSSPHAALSLPQWRRTHWHEVKRCELECRDKYRAQDVGAACAKRCGSEPKTNREAESPFQPAGRGDVLVVLK
jgi:hypothetical protein